MLEVDFKNMENPDSFLNLKQDYFWSFASEIKIEANDVLPSFADPKSFAQFFINLPESFQSQKVSLSINLRPDQYTAQDHGSEFTKAQCERMKKTALEVFTQLLVQKSSFTFRDVAINTNDYNNLEEKGSCVSL